jgi:hypothetical protein
MTDGGTVKVTAEAHIRIGQLNSALGQFNDLVSQIISHGTALTDPNQWAGPAATVFAQQLWPEVQSQLGSLQGTLGGLQSQVSGILSNITQAGSGLPLGGLSSLGSLPVIGGLPLGNL